MTNQKKIEKMLGTKSISQSSEVWEMLALQAVDRCEYLFAFELMQQAVDKAPGKYKLLHLISEVSFLLGYKDRSIHYAENAFEINPQSTDLRTMLLLINPSKWQEKLRNVAPAKSHIKKLGDGAAGMKLQRAGDDEEEEQTWLQKLSASGPAGLFSSSVSPEEKQRRAKVRACLCVCVCVYLSLCVHASLLPTLTSFFSFYLHNQITEAKEKRRGEKQKRKAQKDLARAEEEAKEAAKVHKPGQPRKKRDVMVDGPARPEKPVVTIETKRLLEIAREGKGNLHWYDMTLRKYSEARVLIDRAERQWLSQQKALRGAEQVEED